ncbi:MAG: YceI family protein [Bacteroidota bacterium]|jgi:polyisoprenoid-binding protein YceI
MKKILLSLVLALLTWTAQSQTTWNVDPTHTAIKFSVSHLVITEVEGQFNAFDGKVVTKTDDFSGADINFSIDVASINTNQEKRDAHLKGDDFFNAEKYPKITFEGKSFKKTGDRKYTLTGNLTIRDVTKPVTFDVTYAGKLKDPWGNMKAGFKATTSINRKDYKLMWSAATETGTLVVSDEVAITVNLQLVQAQ